MLITRKVPTPKLVAQCMAALMQNPDIRKAVHAVASDPGGGGLMEKWVSISHEYASEITKKCWLK